MPEARSMVVRVTSGPKAQEPSGSVSVLPKEEDAMLFANINTNTLDLRTNIKKLKRMRSNCLEK